MFGNHNVGPERHTFDHSLDRNQFQFERSCWVGMCNSESGRKIVLAEEVLIVWYQLTCGWKSIEFKDVIAGVFCGIC